jgi:hypothetical protein
MPTTLSGLDCQIEALTVTMRAPLVATPMLFQGSPTQ